MMHLHPGDRGKLVALLAQREDLDTEDERHNALSAAGLEALASKIDLEGAPELVMGRIVDFTARYGEIDGVEALRRLCDWAKTIVGVEQQKLIDEILGRATIGPPDPEPDPKPDPKPPVDATESPWTRRRILLGGIAGGVLVTGIIVVVAVSQCKHVDERRDASTIVGHPDAPLPDASPDAALDAALDAEPPDAPLVDARRPDAPPRPLAPKVRCYLDYNGVKPQSACRGRMTDCKPLGPDEKTNPDWALCYERCTCVQ